MSHPHSMIDPQVLGSWEREEQELFTGWDFSQLRPPGEQNVVSLDGSLRRRLPARPTRRSGVRAR